ncbi:MAG: hypothetical protein AAGF46_06050 [Pseudomonadota bacterium]
MNDRSTRRWLWAGFIVLALGGAMLVSTLVWCIVTQHYLATAPVGALLLMLLWRAETWLDGWTYLLQRRTSRGR